MFAHPGDSGGSGGFRTRHSLQSVRISCKWHLQFYIYVSQSERAVPTDSHEVRHHGLRPLGFRRLSDYAAGWTGRSREEVFSRRSLDPEFDPLNIRRRESRDSAQNPESNAIIVASTKLADGQHPDAFVREGLGTMVQALLDRRPVSDPHVMVMGFGDAWCDRAPLQVTQFEADLRIADQLRGCG